MVFFECKRTGKIYKREQHPVPEENMGKAAPNRSCWISILCRSISQHYTAATKPFVNEILESESASLVTQIVQDQLGGTATCKAVSIEKEASDGFYQAVAYLGDGDELKIAIELKGDQIFASIPDQ